ncbi:hypothetical protein ACFW04_007773 [Cataglyphis niger]
MSNSKKSPDCNLKEATVLKKEMQETVKKKGDSSARPKCKLDSHGCLNLQDILLMFDSPISQERAWALCYQIVKGLSHLTENKFYEISDLWQIVLHKDGDICLESLAGSKQPLVSEEKAIFSLGMAIFKALDFGSNPGEEIALSPDLEALITLMTSCNRASESDVEERLQETDDEGIERDSGDTDAEDYVMPKTTESCTDSSACTLKTILQICERHVQSLHEDADNYYRNVIQMFVEEALSLSQFLEKVVVDKQSQDLYSPSINDPDRNSISLQNIDTLDFNDWTDVRIWRAIQARFWVQVISELRRGVKLKKVEANLGSRASSRAQGNRPDYKLTPYEILMDDIREKRYHLRKTPPTPSRKDAHAIILEFIRSRPPLKKASERRLRPLQKECTLRELLMESIKKPPKPLRSSSSRQNVPRVEETSVYITQNGEDIKEYESSAVPKPSGRNLDAIRRPKKLIPVDFDLKLDAEDDDDDDDDYNDEEFETRFEEEDEASNYWQLKDYSFGAREGMRNGHKDYHQQRDDDEVGSANPWRKTGGLRLTRNEYHRFCDAQLESYDLATQCPSRRASAKKHAAKCTIPLTSLTGTTSLPQSRPQSRQHTGLTDSTLSQGPSPNISLNPSPSHSPQPRAPRQPRRAYTIAHEGKDDKAHGDEWEDDTDKKTILGDMLLDERLSLTLDEIVHIRSVLTKAELESLPVEGRVKEDVEKRRVCFLCLKTRFGLLGPWGQRCRLCKRTVCVKCYSKMRIPTEQFARVPVVLLSPGLLLSPTETETDKNTWLRNAGAIGSAPASPASRRKDSALRSGTPTSTPTMTPVSAMTPTSTPPSHARREMENQGLEKRCFKGSGSPAALSTTKTFSGSSGPTAEQRLAAERLRGVAVVVCHDCRIMVIQIIKSSRTTRATIRNNVISRLTLNLSPAYV